MSATKEQKKIIKAIQKKKCKLLKVSACSGSGKTWTLVEMVKEYNPETALYIAYNKAIATEAATKFGANVECKTTHSLAYRHTVKPFGLKVGYLGYRDIKLPTNPTYDEKLKIIEHIERFCLSKHVSYEDYCLGHDLDLHQLRDGETVLEAMSQGDIPCTHSFYLKLYHILLTTGDVTMDKVDMLLLDEAGDLNEVTLEIFKQIPAKKKVMVGDPNQNIYSFNNTINGFEALKDTGIQLGLTQSFRVDNNIAISVEAFARDTFDENMEFKGITHEDYDIYSRAYISRTNGQLIGKMIELNKQGIPYNLVRPVKSIFALPLSLMGLKKGGFIANPQYKFLQDDTNDYFRSPGLQKQYGTPLAYIGALYKDNPGIRGAINMIHNVGPMALLKAKDIAETYEKIKKTYEWTLCTSHSSKGLEFDYVEIGDDTNTTLGKILSKHKSKWTSQQMEEMRLFYVAVTRARKKLDNAVHLEKYQPECLGFSF